MCLLTLLGHDAMGTGHDHHLQSVNGQATEERQLRFSTSHLREAGRQADKQTGRPALTFLKPTLSSRCSTALYVHLADLCFGLPEARTTRPEGEYQVGFGDGMDKAN